MKTKTLACELIVSATIILLMLAISTAQTQENMESGDTEKGEAVAYKAWFDAKVDKNYTLANQRALSYLKLYPKGRYAEYLKSWIENPRHEGDKENPHDNRHINQGHKAEKEKLHDDPRISELLDALANYKFEALALLLQNLIDSGGDVNMKIKDGKTLLMLAAATGRTRGVEVILSKGADIEARNESNDWTAMLYAVWSGRIDTVQTMIDAGADLTVKDNEEASVLETAILSGRSDMVRLIRSALGKK